MHDRTTWKIEVFSQSCDKWFNMFETDAQAEAEEFYTMHCETWKNHSVRLLRIEHYIIEQRIKP